MKDKKDVTLFDIALWVALSLLLHFFFAAMIYLWSKTEIASADRPKENVVEVDLKDEVRIADILPPKQEEQPKKARYVGVYNSKVEEETVAATKGRPAGRPVYRGGKGEEALKKVSGDWSAFKYEERKEKAQKRAATEDNVIPEDFYPDYKIGEHTYLNVLKYPDISYFVMLKRVFKLAWDPTEVLMRRRMMGEVSRGSIKAVIGLTITRGGTIDELFVINSSGMKDYDEEAMRAIRASSPFATPPEKLLAQDGKLRIAWTFIVYL